MGWCGTTPRSMFGGRWTSLCSRIGSGDPAADAVPGRPPGVRPDRDMTFTPSCVLVTGGAGFIGSNFVRWVLGRDPGVQVINLDLLTYAGNLESLEDVTKAHGSHGRRSVLLHSRGRSRFRHGHQVCCGRSANAEAPGKSALARSIPAPDCIVHMAAESHVDRSIMGPAVFVDTNVRGTLTLLEACRGELAARPRSAVPLRPGEHRRGIRHARSERSGVHRNNAARAQQPLLRQQGRRRSAGPVVRRNVRLSGDHHALLEQLRSVSVPREADSVDDHASARRSSRFPCTATG